MSTPAGEPVVDLTIEEIAWEQALPDLRSHAETATRLALEAAGVDPDRWSVGLLACDDVRIAELNRTFRGKAAPTDVLSWPAFALAPQRPGGMPLPPPEPPRGPRHALGDVAIALQTTQREAVEAAIPLKDHVIHLILHGCLHLLGFDHETEADAQTMEGIEIRALARIGIGDPYARGDAVEPHRD